MYIIFHYFCRRARGYKSQGYEALNLSFCSVKFCREVHFIKAKKILSKYDYCNITITRKTKVVLGERAACLEIVTHGRPNQAGVIRDDSFCISWEYQKLRSRFYSMSFLYCKRVLKSYACFKSTVQLKVEIRELRLKIKFPAKSLKKFFAMNSNQMSKEYVHT